MSDPFVHLHVASGYSMRYGTAHPHAVVERAVDHGMDTVALTDRDGVYGAVKFVKAAMAAADQGQETRRCYRRQPAGDRSAQSGTRRGLRRSRLPTGDSAGTRQSWLGSVVPSGQRYSSAR